MLVAGGLEGVEADPDMFLRDVEVYNPGADSWIELSPLTVPRAFHTTILLPDGHIFVTGGLKQVGSILASTEFLLPAPPIVDTPTWTVKNTPTIETTPGTETAVTPTGTVKITVTPTPTKP